MERNFRTLKERWLYGLDISQIRSLDEFNDLLAAYIRKHNTTEHSTTGETPLYRYLHSPRPVRKPQSAEWLEECFLNRTTHRVSLKNAEQILPFCERTWASDKLASSHYLLKSKQIPNIAIIFVKKLTCKISNFFQFHSRIDRIRSEERRVGKECRL